MVGNLMADPVVLCVDDDADLLATVVRMLRPCKVQLLSTSNPIEALDWIGSKDIAVLVSDYEMPQMNGVELAVSARRVRAETVRILMTGLRSLHTAVEGINQGEIFRYVQKPFEAAALRTIVDEAVARHLELIANSADREQSLRRERIVAELDNEYPNITTVTRDRDGTYTVPATTRHDELARFGFEPILMLGRV
jgi:DNA-binding NtrC family response regulator